jgi:hypothetical protein
MALLPMISHHNHMKVMISQDYPYLRSMRGDGGKGVVPREPKTMEKIQSATSKILYLQQIF